MYEFAVVGYYSAEEAGRERTEQRLACVKIEIDVEHGEGL
jgi:hypothetical protein